MCICMEKLEKLESALVVAATAERFLFRKSGACIAGGYTFQFIPTRWVPSLMDDAAQPRWPCSLTYWSFLETPCQTHLEVCLLILLASLNSAKLTIEINHHRVKLFSLKSKKYA